MPHFHFAKPLFFAAAAVFASLPPAATASSSTASGDFTQVEPAGLIAFADTPPTEGRGSRAQPAAQNKKPAEKKPADTTPPADSSYWTLVLGTFTEGDHESAARQMLLELPRIAPQVSGARVYTSPKGSMVIYGHYTGRDDPNAKADQERLKAITYQNHPVFNRVLITRLDLRLAQGQLHPFDLLSARKAHRKVDPLYTLDIAIWMSNPDAKDSRERVTYDDVKKKAESYASQLRTGGEEAYFYHDDVNQWSIVTVGLFDRRAVDTRSGLYSDEVDALIKKHPVRLANGEPLMEFKNRFNPKEGTVPQRPRLVLVPGM